MSATRDKSQQHLQQRARVEGGGVRLIRHYDLTIRPTPACPSGSVRAISLGACGLRLCMARTLPLQLERSTWLSSNDDSYTLIVRVAGGMRNAREELSVDQGPAGISGALFSPPMDHYGPWGRAPQTASKNRWCFFLILLFQEIPVEGYTIGRRPRVFPYGPQPAPWLSACWGGV